LGRWSPVYYHKSLSLYSHFFINFASLLFEEGTFQWRFWL
jgi:hypothetical protein